MIVSRKHFWEIFLTKLIFNLRSEVSKTYLGYLWWLLTPVFYVSAMYLVFGVFLAMRTDQFMIFLVAGQVPFLWFSRSVSNSANSIIAGKRLIGQVAIPKPLFPLLTITQDMVKQTVVFIAMIGFFLAMGLTPTIYWLGFLPIVIVQFIFIMALALLVSAVVPYFPDLKQLVSTGMRLLMYGSGIFYDYEKVVLPQHRELFLLNPVANLLRHYRDVFLHERWPDWQALFELTLFSLILISFMYFYLKRNDSAYARLIIQ